MVVRVNFFSRQYMHTTGTLFFIFEFSIFSFAGFGPNVPDVCTYFSNFFFDQEALYFSFIILSYQGKQFFKIVKHFGKVGVDQNFPFSPPYQKVTLFIAFYGLDLTLYNFLSSNLIFFRTSEKMSKMLALNGCKGEYFLTIVYAHNRHIILDIRNFKNFQKNNCAFFFKCACCVHILKKIFYETTHSNQVSNIFRSH